MACDCSGVQRSAVPHVETLRPSCQHALQCGANLYRIIFKRRLLGAAMPDHATQQDAGSQQVAHQRLPVLQQYRQRALGVSWRSLLEALYRWG